MWRYRSYDEGRTDSRGTSSGWNPAIDIIGERAKRARHSQVCSIENWDIYIIGERSDPLSLLEGPCFT